MCVSLLRELLAREVVFADLLPAALAVVEVASGYTADFDWGPLLQAAFPQVTYVPGVPPPPPATLGDAQRALLQALVANESLWDPRNGNGRLARMRIGLPNERSAVAKLAGCLDQPERLLIQRRTRKRHGWSGTQTADLPVPTSAMPRSERSLMVSCVDGDAPLGVGAQLVVAHRHDAGCRGGDTGRASGI